MVGGGNTFALVSRCYENQIMNPIRYRISKGGHYIGWSAGSNLACPSIKTTNDMPIVEPYSFNALGLIPFQINPHYTSKTIQGHGAESRDDRIKEFIQMNPKSYVIGLPEGNCIKIKGNQINMMGTQEASIFKSGQNKSSIKSGEDMSFLMEE